MNTSNIDPQEIHKFSESAASWWDTQGPFKPLHEINPLRLQYILERRDLTGLRVLDIGCGGGILSESLARAGAKVNAIDMSEAALEVAKLHQQGQSFHIDYELTTAENFAEVHPHTFDVVTCLEMLEHVPDPSAILKSIAATVKPGGDVFVSTLNREWKAYLFGILGAEYILGLLPRGTHDYAKFIKPSELIAWSQSVGLTPQSITGMTYNPLTKRFRLCDDVSVNYLMHFKKAV